MTGPTLLIVRHGQIKANVEGRWHGATDSPLTAKGRRQSQRTAQYLANRYPQIRAVYTSPLKRCRHTAADIATHCRRHVFIEDDLREYAIGELEDTPFNVLHADLDFFGRMLGDHDFAVPGGDSLNAVAHRMVATLRRINEVHREDTHVAIVTHGAATAIALSTLLHASPGRWQEYHSSNCGITELSLEPEPLIGAFNRTDHL